MNILAIDIGSYSVKFLNGKVDRKGFSINDYHEVIVSHVSSQLPGEWSLRDVHSEILESYIKQNNVDAKIIYQIPSEYTTTRYFELPVNNKKKAEMMIPFQLDENLPYPISSCHYNTTFLKKGNSISALVNIAQLEHFDTYYNYIKEKNIVPAILSSEVSLLQSALEEEKMNGSYCILDIGHNTTKAYFIHNRRVIANHTSHIAGNTIDQIISKTYDINQEDAVIYKHDNCFFLTESQYEEVDEDQREFAKLMKQTMWPLIHDLKRWSLGYRIQHSHSVDKIFITGGTTNINNIANFISQASEVPVEHLNLKKVKSLKSKEINSSQLAQMMIVSQKSKILPSNFLNGDYSSDFSTDIPLHSSAFIFTRVAAVCMLIIFSLLIERNIIIKPQIKKLDRRVSKLIKTDRLNIPSKTRRLYKRKPERILSFLKKRNNTVKQEVKTIMAATRINAVSPLLKLSKILPANDNIDLVLFNSSNNMIKATFASDKHKELAKMKEFLSTADLKNMRIDYKTGNTKLVLEFSGE